MTGDPHNPCHLEGQFKLFMDEFRVAQGEQLRLLEEIAGQRTTLKVHDIAINELKKVTHGLELKPGRTASKIFLIVVSAGVGLMCSVVGSMITGFIMLHQG